MKSIDEFPHIDTMWKRKQDGTKRPPIICGEYSNLELQYLKDLTWLGTEKLDGTNVRISLTPRVTQFFGRHGDNLPSLLYEYLTDVFVDRAMSGALKRQFIAAFDEETPVTLFGEGVGAKVHPGSGKYGFDPKFILFDVKVGDWWLTRPNVEDVGRGLQLPVAPVVFTGKLYDAHMRTVNGMESTFGDCFMEGLVLQPMIQLFNRKGERILCKVKHQDYLDLSRRDPAEAFKQGVYVNA